MKWRSLEESAAESESRSLREIYADRKALIEKYVPADVQSVHARVVADLQQSCIVDRALKPGTIAPDFELPDQHGKQIRSAELLEPGPVVVCFIRGRWCPFCVGQMEALNAILPQLQQRGASLTAISPQTVHHNYLMTDQHKLGFPVLSDAGNRVAREFGLVYRVPDYQQEVYRRVFTNLPFLNGDSSWELPIPATFIIANTSKSEISREPESSVGRDGAPQSQIVFAAANPDYTDRPEPADILKFVAQLSS
jgi:peroxiredoxin